MLNTKSLFQIIKQDKVIKNIANETSLMTVDAYVKFTNSVIIIITATVEIINL